MKRLMLPLVVLLVFWPEAGRAAGPPEKQPPRPGIAPNGSNDQALAVPADTGKFLPDTAVLARVDRRVVRVIDFRDRYWASDALYRPVTDSLGRAEFLNSMINKEVMGLTALRIDRPLTFEDRVNLREFSNTVFQNMMHKRMVTDSISITEDDLRAGYSQFSYEQRLRGILFEDRATAERVRRDLAAGRISWKDAAHKYWQDPTRAPDEEATWVKRGTVSGDFALKAFSLAPGGISEVVQDVEGYHVLQCLERRTVSPPVYVGVRRAILNDLRAAASNPRVQRMFQAVRAAAEVTYDTTNIKWAAARFREELPVPSRDPGGIDLSDVVPHFEGADTGRVLARTRDRHFTVRQFVEGYAAIPVVLRRRVVSLEPFIFALDGMFLEPHIIALARAGGFDRESLAVAMIEQRREQLLVEHLFQDSILSRVSVTPAKRKRYYQERRKEFVSIPRARYARLVRGSEAAADSLIARLRAGESPEAIVAADSLQGRRGGAIQESSGNQPGILHQVLFEELKPGQVTKVGPDAEGYFVVVQLMSLAESRPLAYEDVEHIVDESVQNIEAERLLKAFLARNKRRYRIESHPELVMQIHLVDPALELRLN